MHKTNHLKIYFNYNCIEAILKLYVLSNVSNVEQIVFELWECESIFILISFTENIIVRAIKLRIKNIEREKNFTFLCLTRQRESSENLSHICTSLFTLHRIS